MRNGWRCASLRCKWEILGEIVLESASCAGLSELRGKLNVKLNMKLNVNLKIRIYEENLFER